MGALRLAFVLPAAAILTLVLMPIQAMALKVWPEMARRLPAFYHRHLLNLFGVRRHVRGTVCSDRPLLLVANHSSWLDIAVLSSAQPLSFIAKSEMGDWFLFGTLARLQRTIFVKREQRHKAGAQAGEIADRLSQNDVMVLFAEGTTNTGNYIFPFKSSLLGAAQLAIANSQHDSIGIQPVSVTYTTLHGMKIGRGWMQHVAWPGDVTLGAHLLAVAREGALDVTVRFGDTLRFTPSSDRKQMTANIEASVKDMALASLRGPAADTARSLDKNTARR